MSLINDALKKAQKQRTGEAPSLGSLPSVGGESPHRIAKRSKPAGFDTLVMRAGIGGAVVLVLAVGGFFLFRDKPSEGGPASLRAGSGQETPAASSSPSTPVTNPQVSSSAVGQAKAEGPRSQVSEPAAPPAQPAFTLPVAPKSEPAASPQGGPASLRAGSTQETVANSGPQGRGPSSNASPAASSSQTQAQQPAANNQQPAPVSAPAAPPRKLEPHAIEFIENIKVAGIRASATDAKVLMNDRVYRPGSLVSAEFGLKLVDITANSLTFEDDKGGRYTRTF